MLSSFILNAELLPVDGFAGLIAQCHFSVADYHDDLFAAAGIDFPEHVAPAVAKRKAEYLAGRYLARWVLAELGHQDFTLLRGRNVNRSGPLGLPGRSVTTAIQRCALLSMRVGQVAWVLTWKRKSHLYEQKSCGAVLSVRTNASGYANIHSPLICC